MGYVQKVSNWAYNARWCELDSRLRSAEALNGTFKAELIHLHGPWLTRTQTELAIVEWIDWYNSARLHSSIGYIPPLEHETDWYLHNNHPADLVGTH